MPGSLNDGDQYVLSARHPVAHPTPPCQQLCDNSIVNAIYDYQYDVRLDIQRGELDARPLRECV